jgi:hypothetical protein
VKNSIVLDSNALAQLGTPAAGRKRGESEHPIWISIGPQNSGVKLGYRASEPGAWLAALTFEGERLEATLGPADDENAPPEALNIWDTASAAFAWAESERARIGVGSRAVATPGTAADLSAELDAARAAQAIAETHAEQFEAERDSAVAARESLRTLATHLIGERAYLAGQLTRAYQRPWKPIKLAINHTF